MISEIGELILTSPDLQENDWESFSLVYDIGEGHTANSGFLYDNKSIAPFFAESENDPMEIDNQILALQQEIQLTTGHKFKQLLIQMEKNTNKIKIDFEFDNPNRWSITPANMKEMKELLRPKFDSL